MTDGEERSNPDAQVETPTDRAARLTATATVWMAVFTFALAATSILTIWVLINQLKEMREGGIDTHALAQATEASAKAASDQAGAAQKFADTAKDINGGISRAADQLGAASKNARVSIKATQDAMHLEQRAWIGVTSIHLIEDMKAEKPIGVVAVMINSGRTVALDMKNTMIVHTNVGYLDIADYATHPTEKSGQIKFGLKAPVMNMFPTQTMNLPGYSGVANAEAVEAIHDGRRLVYAFGWITYKDIFNKPHETRFCGVYVPDDKVFTACDTFNYAD